MTSSFDKNTAGISTLQIQVAGHHRASPSAALDKDIFNFQIIIVHSTEIVNIIFLVKTKTHRLKQEL